MAEKTQRAQVLKVALSAALHDGQDMIGIPQCLSREPLESPFSEKPQAMGPTRASQFPIGSAGIDSADRADAPVPLENLFAKVAGVRTEAPFVDAPIRTKCETTRRDFQATPAAKRAAVRPFWQSGSIGEAARHYPRSAQRFHNIFSIKCFWGARWASSCWDDGFSKSSPDCSSCWR